MTLVCTPSSSTTWLQAAFEWAANMNAERSSAVLLDLVESPLEADRRLLVRGRTTPKNAPGVTPRPDTDPTGWPADCAFRPGDRVSGAFYIACRNGQHEVARLLLDRGAEVATVGYFGATALHWGRECGHDSLAERLDDL
jgi:hypothetical protein